jgi:biopolymer transport protein ExbD
MKFRSRRPDDVDINLTSLIDVVLLLLIFFMVSTRFVEGSKIDLTLPAASAQAASPLPVVINVSIDRQAQCYVAGRPLINGAVDTIRLALLEASASLKDPVVVISADRETNFQRVVDVMDAARQANLTHVTFPLKVREPD